MFKLLKSVFSNSIPKRGEIYVFDDDDPSPFETEPPHRVEVVEVRNGWVSYRYPDLKHSSMKSCRLSSFRYAYRLANIACSGQEPA